MGFRVAVIHNIDYLHRQDAPDGAPSIAADAEVADTAQAIAAVIRLEGHRSEILTVDHTLDGLIERLSALRIDLVFNLVESLGGDAARECELPDLLAAHGIRCTGNRGPALRAAHAKDRTREILAAAGVPIPKGLAVEGAEAVPADPSTYGLSFPLFVKPARTDASIGIDRHSRVHNRIELIQRLEWLSHSLPGPYLIEAYLPGREINVAILTDPADGPLALTEVDFSGYPSDIPAVVTYDCKWTPGSPEYVAQSRPCGDGLAPTLRAEISATARAAFVAIGGHSYGRVDFRLDAAGHPQVIDVNPNPDLHPDAGFSIAARSLGLDHSMLIAQLIRQASAGAPHGTP